MTTETQRWFNVDETRRKFASYHKMMTKQNISYHVRRYSIMRTEKIQNLEKCSI